MPMYFSKHFGGKHFGTSIFIDRHGMKKGSTRLSFCGWSCFKS